MRRLAWLAAAGMFLAVAGTAGATTYWFRFSEEDLWAHTTSGDSALYAQDAPRRHHTSWKSNVQTTDSAQTGASEYQRSVGMGTNGFPQTATYDSWLGAGPVDNAGNAFGICEVQLWGANFPNSKYAWGERFKLADTGQAAWTILATPVGWTGVIIQNPWPDPGYLNPMYFIDWYANNYDQRILYSKYGDGVEDYVFEFTVDIVGEYPSYPSESSLDGNPFEADGTLRIWFGGCVLSPSGVWTNEGFDGVMELNVVPEPVTMVGMLIGVGGLVRYVRRRRAA